MIWLERRCLRRGGVLPFNCEAILDWREDTPSILSGKIYYSILAMLAMTFFILLEEGIFHRLWFCVWQTWESPVDTCVHMNFRMELLHTARNPNWMKSGAEYWILKRNFKSICIHCICRRRLRMVQRRQFLSPASDKLPSSDDPMVSHFQKALSFADLDRF